MDREDKNVLDICVIVQTTICLIGFVYSFFWVWKMYTEFNKEYQVMIQSYQQPPRTITVTSLSQETMDEKRKTSTESSNTYGVTTSQEDIGTQLAKTMIADTPMTRNARKSQQHKSVRGTIDAFDDLFCMDAYEQLTRERVEHRALTITRSVGSSHSIATGGDIANHSEVLDQSGAAPKNDSSLLIKITTAARQEKRISFGSLQKSNVNRSQVQSEQREEVWENEKVTIYSLMYFNVLLIVYNVLFLVFATLDMLNKDYKTLIVCLPLIQMFQVFINTNFTMRYQSLARIMHIYFCSDLECQMKAISKRHKRRNQWQFWLTVVSIYALQTAGCVLRITGNFCIAEEEDLIFTLFRENNMNSCRKQVFTGLALTYLCFLILVVIQFISTMTIFKVAKQNAIAANKTLCKMISYILIFIVIFIIMTVNIPSYFDYSEDSPDLMEIEHDTFFLIAVDGALLQPYFFYQLYRTTHQKYDSQEVRKGSFDDLNVQSALRDSAQSSEFHFGSAGHSSNAISQSSYGRDSSQQSKRWSNYDDRLLLMNKSPDQPYASNRGSSPSPSNLHALSPRFEGNYSRDSNQHGTKKTHISATSSASSDSNQSDEYIF